MEKEKCRVCRFELSDSRNCSYEDGICDDCFEEKCDNEIMNDNEDV